MKRSPTSSSTRPTGRAGDGIPGTRQLQRSACLAQALLPLRIYSHTHLDNLLLAWQMRTNSSVNASQKRSFDEQLGRGRKLPPKSRLGLARTHDRTLPKISQESSYRTWRACPLRPLATKFGTTSRRQRSGCSPRFLRRLKRTPTSSMSYRISSAPVLASQIPDPINTQGTSPSRQ